MHALVGNGFSGDTYVVRIRDSGTGSAPTTSSAIVAQNTFVPSPPAPPAAQASP